MKGILFFIVIATARISIYDNLEQKQFLQLKYCIVNLTQNHAGWSILQPESEWTNVTFNATFEEIQVTSIDSRVSAGYIVGWTIDYGNPLTPVTMHVNYWGVYEALYFATYPAPCTRYDVHVRYGKHIHFSRFSKV